MARQRALFNKVPAEKLEVVGLPVAARYCVPAGNQRALRKKLGWPLDKPIALLVGGGDGMGPLGTTAQRLTNQAWTWVWSSFAGGMKS